MQRWTGGDRRHAIPGQSVGIAQCVPAREALLEQRDGQLFEPRLACHRSPPLPAPARARGALSASAFGQQASRLSRLSFLVLSGLVLMYGVAEHFGQLPMTLMVSS